MMNKEIPNCAICKWMEKQRVVLNILEVCQAQAFKCVSNVYNNKFCKKLYEKKEIIGKKYKYLIDIFKLDTPYVKHTSVYRGTVHIYTEKVLPIGEFISLEGDKKIKITEAKS